MFNWFKNNHKSYLPPDIERAFLTSKDAKLKLGSTIALPTNTVCYLSFKDKIYLDSDSFLEISSKNLQHLIDKQSKPNKQIKEIRADLFFINLSEQERIHSYRDKLKFGKKLIKTAVNVNLKLKVNKPKQLLSFVLSELALPSAEDSDNLIFGYFEEFLRGQFLKRTLDDDKIEGELYEDLVEKSSKFFSKIGIEMISLEIALNFVEDKNNIAESKNASFFDDLYSKPGKNGVENSKSVDENHDLEYNGIIQEKQTTETKLEGEKQTKNSAVFCPICNMKLIVGSKFCHRCGYRIN